MTLGGGVVNDDETVLQSLEPMLRTLARRAARRAQLPNLTDDLIQSARVAAWEALGRYDGRDGARLETFVWATVEAQLKDAVREERSGCVHVDRNAMRTYGQMLRLAEGDLYLAERLCQSAPEAGRRLSADRAEAARLAWMGAKSLDAPVSPSGATLGETLPAPERALRRTLGPPQR